MKGHQLAVWGLMTADKSSGGRNSNPATSGGCLPQPLSQTLPYQPGPCSPHLSSSVSQT